MSFSSLTDGILRTNNHSGYRNHSVCRITPHYMCAYWTGEQCCESFVPPERRASANYCIGYDGKIWGNVDEEYRAWTSGSAYNDNRAITIECACYVDGARYGVIPDSTWNSLVELCVDICTRYGFYLDFTGDDDGTLTMHKWYDDTDCPGDWFSRNFGRLADEVNARLDGKPSPTPDPPTVFGGTYICNVNGLRVRDAPTTSGNVITHYDAGQVVELDDWYTSCDGYIWGRYTGASSGELRYVAVGLDTGKVEDDDFLVRL